jgi:cobalt-zinc-cadmium efflux system outer membrane protein
LYPNPVVGWASEEMGQLPGSAGFQGPFISQDIVTAGKLEIAQAAASREVEATDWQIVSRRFDLMTRVRIAYFDVLAAQLAIEENEKIIKLAEESLNAAKKLQAVGGGIKPDVLRAEIELSQSRIRLAIAQQSLATAGKILANTVGIPELSTRKLEGKLDGTAPHYEWESAVHLMLSHSADIRAAQARVEQAQALLGRAEADAIPNVNVKMRPFYTFAEKRFEYTIEAGIALPIFNRNQGNIHAAQADVARAGQEARLVELQLVDRLANAFQRYQNALNQTEKYQTEILPKARQARDAVQQGYQSGAGDTKFDYTSVLQAQQTYVQAQLAYIQSLSDLWRAISEIAGLLQQEDW